MATLRGLISAHYVFPYNFTRCYLRPRHWIGVVKFIYNRIHHGVSYQDVWSFDHHLASIICKGIEELYEGPVYPSHLDSFEEWQAILADMHEGFYAYCMLWEEDYDKDDDWQARQNRIFEKLDKSLALFKEHYMSLWD